MFWFFNKTKGRHGDKERFIIPIESLFKSFKEHMEESENSRILFSGKFGIGKTYFLREFFKKHGEEYFAVHLHPSRYQIADNEKILDYIKTDILTSILKQSNVSKLEPPRVLAWISGVRTKLSLTRTTLKKVVNNECVALLLSMGEDISAIRLVVKAVLKIAGKEKVITEEKIKNELKKVVQQKENAQPEEEAHLKKVLIVDDLDRLDPEHIFRICNVFSAFVGEEGEETMAEKLGFDTVIFVADYKNLKTIFHHKYGSETEHQGYFDKFYSKDVFAYEPKEIIHKWIWDTFYSIAYKDNEDYQKDAAFPVNKWLTRILLVNFLRIDKLNLRQLFSGLEYGMQSLPQYDRSDGLPPQRDENKRMQNTMSFLIKTIGSKEELIEAIERSLGEDASVAFDIFRRSPEGNYASALKDNIKRIFGMIEHSDSEKVLSAELMEIQEGAGSGRSEDVLDTLKKLLILYLNKVHQPND